MPKNIVIVGAGAAGVFTAYLLEKNAPGIFNIKILEKNDAVGGHTRGHCFNENGESIHIDCGAQFFYETSEPEYCDMLREEEFFVEPGWISQTEVGITIWNTTKQEVNFKLPNQLSDILGSVVNDPLDWLNFSILTGAAIEKYALSDWSETFGDWLEGLPFWGFPSQREAFKKRIARPLLYQFGLVDPDVLEDLSAKFVIYYYVTSLPWPVSAQPPPGASNSSGSGPFKLYTCNIGMDGILRKLLKKYSITHHESDPVSSIEPSGTGWKVTTANGVEHPADEIVFATNPQWTQALLPATPDFDQLRALLTGMKYLSVPVHTQYPAPSYMPDDPADWSVSNVTVAEDSTTGETTHYGMSVWFGPLKQEAIGQDYFKAWGSPSLNPPGGTKVVGQVHRLMVGTPDFIERRQKLRSDHQGKKNMWHVGGYILDYDTQNSCLKSAAEVSSKLIEQELVQPLVGSPQFLMQPELLQETRFEGKPELLNEVERSLLDSAIEHPSVREWAEGRPRE